MLVPYCQSLSRCGLLFRRPSGPQIIWLHCPMLRWSETCNDLAYRSMPLGCLDRRRRRRSWRCGASSCTSSPSTQHSFASAPYLCQYAYWKLGAVECEHRHIVSTYVLCHTGVLHNTSIVQSPVKGLKYPSHRPTPRRRGLCRVAVPLIRNYATASAALLGSARA